MRVFRWEFLIGLALLAATVYVYRDVRDCGFVNYDDPLYVTENTQVQAGLTWKGVRWAFTSIHAGFWIPLTWLSLMADCEVHGLNAGGYHLTNLLLHAANALLLFLLLRQMTGARWRSAFVASLFALHPLHVESVAWVTERKDVLSTFFWLLALLVYAHYGKRPKILKYLAVLAFFMLGLMAKPMVVTLPFVLILLDFWPLGRLAFTAVQSDGRPLNKPGQGPSCGETLTPMRSVLEKAPFFIVALIFSSVALFSQKHGGNYMASLDSHSLGERITNALVSYGGYIRKMFWPNDLAVFYPHQGSSLPVWQAIASAALLSALCVFVIKSARRHPYLPIGWFWYLGTLVPVIGLVQVGSQSMADRFTYVPLVGLFIMISWGVPAILTGWLRSKVFMSILGGVVLLALSLCTSSQIGHWQNSDALFTHAAAVTSDNYIAHNNLGAARAENGDWDEAVRHLSESLRIRPRYAEAHNNMGSTLTKQGRLTEAVNHFETALWIRPGWPEVHNNMGVALAKLGRLEEAMSHFSEALALQPGYVNASRNLETARQIAARIAEGSDS